MRILTVGPLQTSSDSAWVQIRCLSDSVGLVNINFPKQAWPQDLKPNGKMIFWLGVVQTFSKNGQLFVFNNLDIKCIELSLRRRTESEYPTLLLNNIALPIMQDVPPEERFDTVVQILTMFSQTDRTDWPRVWLYSLQCLANLFDGTPIIASSVIPFVNTNAQLWFRFSDGFIVLKEEQNDYTDGVQVGSMFIILLQGTLTRNFVFYSTSPDQRPWLKAINIMEEYLTYRFNLYFKPKKRRP